MESTRAASWYWVPVRRLAIDRVAIRHLEM
jgi:hypothetical protein